jgi:hypothetical protein
VAQLELTYTVTSAILQVVKRNALIGLSYDKRGEGARSDRPGHNLEGSGWLAYPCLVGVVRWSPFGGGAPFAFWFVEVSVWEIDRGGGDKENRGF